jgi:metal-dependent amidase/aminoacylase/carboxypeptidase family protein
MGRRRIALWSAVVVAAEAVTALQTIPQQSDRYPGPIGALTIGSIHGGNRENINSRVRSNCAVPVRT